MNPNRANFAFIDNENVNVSVQKQKWKIDRGKFRERLRTERNVEVAYMFMGYLEEYQPMYEFFTSLGYTLVFRPMNPNPDVPNKGNIDTDLVLQAMIDRPNYNQAVIVSGDGDFASLVKHLNEQKKLATVIVPNERRYSGFLNDASGDKIVSLSLLKTTLRYTPSSKKKEGGSSGVRKEKKSPSPEKQELLKYTTKHTPKRAVNAQSNLNAQSSAGSQGSQRPQSSQGSQRSQPANSQRQKPQASKSSAQKPQASKPQTQNIQQSSKPQATSQRPAQQNVRNNQARSSQSPQRSQSAQPSKPLQSPQPSQKPRPPQNTKPTTPTGTNKPSSRYTSNDDAFYA